MPLKRTFSPEQITASDPLLNVWVQANAGTGKTSVLIQRLLRILFRTYKESGKDASGDGILCLTYTNTGASEMRNRILSALREWAYKDDDELAEMLIGISHNNPVKNDDLIVARNIFYRYIDNPDMLKIRTIHSFCEEILRRFPIEAGIQPAWRLVSGAEQKRLLRDTFHILINSPAESDYLNDAFLRVTAQISEHSLENLLNILTEQYRYIFKIKNYSNYRQQFIDNAAQFLKVSTDALNAFYTSAAHANRISILETINSESKPAGYLLKISEYVKKYFAQAVANAKLSDSEFNIYKNSFLTALGTKNSNVSKKDYLSSEQDLVYNLAQENLNREIFENTVALFDLTDAFASKYRKIKQSRGLLDFDDLILYTDRLFSNQSKMGWVLSQLDNNLRHILVDEAQDTSPEQWDILKSITTNFFNNGEKENPKSIFVVGDTKQSIFSFQGADPSIFTESKTSIGQQILTDMRQIDDVPLAESFRSAGAILSTVDFFFNDVSIGCLTKFINNSHKVFRTGDAGLVEIHNMFNCDEYDNTANGRHKYIKGLVDKIEHLIKNEMIESSGNPIMPHDIMILVQRRNPFVAPLISELQARKIPVAGSDRIFLPDFPAIRDLIYIVRFAFDTTDDYMLACVLKSSLFGFNEDELFKICRKKIESEQNLFEILKKDYPEIHSEISELTYFVNKLPPYSFFMKLLNSKGRRAKMLRALGQQIVDPLEEFLTIALSYERTQAGNLKQFYKWFIEGGAEIKRDIDTNSGVRIMTAHSSKGLDSPIVFLIDTVRNPKTGTNAKISEPIAINGGWVWRGRAESSENFDVAKNIKYDAGLAEYYRLLYVAMTRARDRLYIHGFKGARESATNSWHEQLYGVLANHPDAVMDENETIRIYNPQTKSVSKKHEIKSERHEINDDDLKNLLNSDALSEPIKPMCENNSDEQKQFVSIDKFLSDIDKNKYATETGSRVHAALQKIVINSNGIDYGNSELIEKIKSHPGLIQFFSKDSRTEVPLAGTIDGKFISRRIDRMIIKDREILFIDYKTDTDKSLRRAHYQKQMSDYAALLRNIYPDYKIVGFILWLTDWQLEQVV